MERLAVVVGVVVVALAVSWWLDRRQRPDAPTQARASAPAQLDRDDFGDVDTPWLVVVFTSSTCRSCAETVVEARRVSGHDVTVVEAEVHENPEVHRRYDISAVPTVVVADRHGVVRRAFVGPPATGELAASLTTARSGVGDDPDQDAQRRNG